jgi:hypothetical protein
MSESKYWSEMFIKKIEQDSVEKLETDFIISYDAPVKYESKKPMTFKEGIDESELEEISEFYSKHNKMSSGNTTLFPPNEIKRYINMDNRTILMRSVPNNNLIGTIMSLVLPVKCNNNNNNNNNNKIIIHGCTTFLNIHTAIRGNGIAMALIRKLIEVGYEQKQYCSYYMVPFKIGDNSIPINSWYRPLNIKRAESLGFGIPQESKIKSQLKYKNRLLPQHNYNNVKKENLKLSLDYYLNQIKDKRFVFYPTLELWQKWIESFSTYLIYGDNAIVGLVSINTVHCLINSTQKISKILYPVLCVGDMNIVLPVLNYIGFKENFDIIYYQEHGDLTSNHLESNHAIKTQNPSWFSLYNNNIEIKSSDIYVPLL